MPVAEDSYYRWQRVRLEQARRADPDHVQDMAERATTQLAQDMRADRDLIDLLDTNSEPLASTADRNAGAAERRGAIHASLGRTHSERVVVAQPLDVSAHVTRFACHQNTGVGHSQS